MIISDDDDDAILARALKAYFRDSPHADYPGAWSAVEHLQQTTYAVLRNVNGTLAVFVASPTSSRLKRLDTWPKELDTT